MSDIFYWNFDFFTALSDFDFLKQSLFISLCTGVVTAPLGVLLVLRRMSLMGDAISHGLLPGVAVSYFFFGSSILAMTIGGLLTGSLIVFLTAWSQKHSPLKEDSSFAAFYLISLSFGVLLISQKNKTSMDLMHILFGSPLSITLESLIICLLICFSIGLLFWLFKNVFILEIFDPVFLKSRGKNPFFYQSFFLLLVVAGLVVSFQNNGTLLAIGQLILPGIIARMWTSRITLLITFSILISIIGSLFGLFLSFELNALQGPTTLMIWGIFYLLSLFFNPSQGIIKSFFHLKHYGS